MGRPMKPTFPRPLALSLRINSRVARIVILWIALLVALAAMFLAARPLSQWEAQLSDKAWGLWPDTTPEERVVIVAIDEPSLSEIGAWPWSRETLAALATRLEAEGVALQLYDIVLPEARPGDEALANTLSTLPAVLAQVPQLAPASTLRSGHLGDPLPGVRCQAPITETTSFLGNHSAFSALPKGHITPRIDADGVMRHQAPLLCVNGRVYPSLALRGLLYAAYPAGIESNALQLTPGRQLESGRLTSAPWNLSLNALGLNVPLNAQGDMRLSYRADPQVFNVVSASDVLNKRVPEGWLDNAWVLIGATAFGLGDYLPSPHAAMTPGVELQARLLTSLLDQRIPYTPRMAPLLQAAIMLASALFLLGVAASAGRVSDFGLPVAGMALPLVLLAAHYTMLLHFNLWIGWLLPALFAALASALLLLLEYGRTRLERLRLYANLSSYLPEKVAQEIAYHQPSGAIEATRQALVVLCADLRNFAPLQDALAPEEAAAVLHSFFVMATQIVEAEGGSVHEFKGDSLLATWPQEAQGAERAVTAGRRLVQESSALLPIQLPQGLSPLSVGVGVEQGSALVGSIGPAHRRHHSLLGQPVSLALRIQAMTAELGQPLLVGENAARMLTTPLDDQGSYLLEGIRQPQRLYALMPSDLPSTEWQETPLLHLVKG